MKQLLAVDRLLIKDFINELKAQKNGYATISLRLRGIKSFYDEILSIYPNEQISNPFDGYIKLLPKGHSNPVKPTLAMTEDEADRMLQQPNINTLMGKRDYAILCLGFGAGLRISSILSIKAEDYQPVTAYGVPTLTLYNLKTVNREEISLSPWVSGALADYLSAVGRDVALPFFMTRMAAHKMFKKYLRKAGIAGRYSFHSARATGITLVLDGGATHREAQDFSGHTNVNSVIRYDGRRKSVKNNPGLRLIIGGRA